MSSPGGFDLGTATGRVRIEYDSAGASKVVKELQDVNKTIESTANKWVDYSKQLGIQGNSLSRLTEIQKAYNNAVKVQQTFDNLAAKTRADTTAGYAQNFQANKLALQAQKSVADLGRVLATANSKLPQQLATQGSIAAAGYLGGFERTGTQRAAAAAKNVGGALSKGLGVAVVGGLAAATAAVAVAAAGVGYVVSQGISRAVQLDTAQHKLEALGKTAGQVKAITETARAAVMDTQYALTDAMSAAGAAIAAGIKPGDDLKNYLTTIANAAAITGDSFESMAHRMNAVQANNKAFTDDIRMMQDQGLPIMKALATQYGVTQAAMAKMASDGKVDAAHYRAAIESITKGGAAEMGKSFTGMIANIHASISRIGEALVKPLEGEAGGALSSVLNWLKNIETWIANNQDTIVDFWTNLGKGVLTAARIFVDAAGIISDAIIKITQVTGDLGGWGATLLQWGAQLTGAKDKAEEFRKAAEAMHHWGDGDQRANRDQNLQSLLNALNRGWISLEEFNKRAKAADGTVADFSGATDDAGSSVESFSDKLKDAGISLEDLVGGIEGTTEQYEKLLKLLQDKGFGNLIGSVQQLRNQFEHGGRQVKDFAAAIDKLHDSTASADDKAKTLIETLQGLGQLPKQDAVESYSKALREAVSASDGLVDPLEKAGNELLNTNGTLNVALKNGAELNDRLEKLRESAYALGASGQADPAEVWRNTTGVMKDLTQQFGISSDAADQLIQIMMGGDQDTFIKRITAPDVRSAFENEFKNDPAKLKTALDLLDNSTEDILKQITGLGADGALHVPTTLDVTNPNVLGQISAIPGPPTVPTIPSGGDLNKPLTPEQRKAAGIPDELPPIYPGASPEQATPEASKSFETRVSDAIKRYEDSHQEKPRSFWEKLWDVGHPNNIAQAQWPGGQFYQQQALTQQNQDALKNTKVVDEILGQNYELQNQLGTTEEQYKAKGKTLADAYADGILSGSEEVRDAIKKLAEIAGDGLGNSPAKYGPLSGNGWSYFRGKKFTVAFADGIASESGAVAGATGDMAGSATSTADEAIAQWISDAREFSDFGQHVLDIINSIANIATNILQIADTIQGGNLFPKNYVKDPAAQAKAQQKQAQDDRLRALGVDPNNLFSRTSDFAPGINVGAPGALPANASKQQIANYIMNKALSSGYSQKQAEDILTQAFGESGLDPTISGGVQGGVNEVVGIFQEMKAFSGGLSREDRQNAQKNIDAYFAQMAAHGGPAAFTDPAQFLGIDVSGGGPFHPENQAKGHLRNAQAGVAPYIQGYTPETASATTALPAVVDNLSNVVSKLQDTGRATTIPNLQRLAADLTRLFPGIASIGGSRDTNTAKNTHDTGTSIDVGIGDVNAKNQAMGDVINAWIRQNAANYGLKYTIWRDQWQDFQGSKPTTVGGHQNHIDVHADPGAAITVDGHPEVTMPNVTAPQMASALFGGEGPQFYQQAWEHNKDFAVDSKTGWNTQLSADQEKTFRSWVAANNAPFDVNAMQNDYDMRGYFQALMNGSLKPDQIWRGGPNDHFPDQFKTPYDTTFSSESQYAKPGTPFNWQGDNLIDSRDGSLIYGQQQTGQPNTGSNTMLGILGSINQNTAALTDSRYGLSAQMEQAAARDSLLDQAIQISRGSVRPDDATSTAALQHLDTLIADQNKGNTPQSKAMAQELGGIRSGVMSQTGFTEGTSTIQAITQIVSGITGVAGDAINIVTGVIDSIESASKISDTLVRGISNTQDIVNIIDEVQTFITLAATVAQTVSDGLALAATITGVAGAASAGGDMGSTAAVSAALGIASSIAGIVATAISTINAVIDLGQMAYSVVMKYIGRGLLSQFGLPNATDIRYLLDTTTHELQVYSSSNPQLKNSFDDLTRGLGGSYGSRGQGTVNNFNIYQGPGQDYRDTMNDTMFAVRSSGVTAFGFEGDRGF